MTTPFPKTLAFFLAAGTSLLTLVPLSQIYRECKAGLLGTEMEVRVLNVPEQKGRGMGKYMYVGIGAQYVPVYISGPDYHRERFKKGQIVTVKYHPASGYATLSGELDWRIIFYLVLMGGSALAMWIIFFRVEPGKVQV